MKHIEKGRRKILRGTVLRGAGASAGVSRKKNLGPLPPGSRIANTNKKRLSSTGARRVVRTRGKSHTTGSSSSRNFNCNNC